MMSIVFISCLWGLPYIPPVNDGSGLLLFLYYLIKGFFGYYYESRIGVSYGVFIGAILIRVYDTFSIATAIFGRPYNCKAFFLSFFSFLIY